MSYLVHDGDRRGRDSRRGCLSFSLTNWTIGVFVTEPFALPSLVDGRWRVAGVWNRMVDISFGPLVYRRRIGPDPVYPSSIEGEL